jgi:hypothetical protein
MASTGAPDSGSSVGGTEGPDGPDGPEGPDGPDGPEGPDGPDGPEGPDGPDGRNDPDWVAITRRNARSVQTTIGWIFWDPGAVARYEVLGLPGPLGYIAARCAPFAGAGPEAVAAAFGSISPLGIAMAFDQLGGQAQAFRPFWYARDAAVVEGLLAHAPDILEPLVDLGPDLWAVVERLPFTGRPFAASHLAMPRPEDLVLSGWHAVNVLREWRGDTHWAIVAAQGLSGDEASILHNAWLGYDGDWLSLSRGNSPESIDEAWRRLASKGLARPGGDAGSWGGGAVGEVDGGAVAAGPDRCVTEAGLDLRQWIEDETDRRTTLPWELLGETRSIELAERLEPPCEQLLRRVDETAGERYQPASRRQPPA